MHLDIVTDGFKAGIRPGEQVQRDMVAVRVAPNTATTVAGPPADLAGRTTPRLPHDLRHHACISSCFAGSGALFRWPFASGSQTLDVVVEGPLTLTDTG